MEYGTGAAKATYRNGAKNLISTTVYSIACKFDALTDMEELYIQKSSDLPTASYLYLGSVSVKYRASILEYEVATEQPLNLLAKIKIYPI